ncbi:hypothetical protein NMY22_g9421 [Coprinellus aureogranulatus]|nr:hypothetical protein NMY22_g9421 [Coprinellus aureogranulatus]
MAEEIVSTPETYTAITNVAFTVAFSVQQLPRNSPSPMMIPQTLSAFMRYGLLSTSPTTGEPGKFIHAFSENGRLIGSAIKNTPAIVLSAVSAVLAGVSDSLLHGPDLRPN